jgi:hypothetical protein
MRSDLRAGQRRKGKDLVRFKQLFARSDARGQHAKIECTKNARIRCLREQPLSFLRLRQMGCGYRYSVMSRTGLLREQQQPGVTQLDLGVWGATEQKTGLVNCGYSSSGVSALLRGRSCPCATESGSANAYRPRKLM